MSKAQRRIEPEDAESGLTQYLTFMLGGEIFAIGILAIKEIIEYDSVTEVPMMPECIRGVINLRGAVVPVMDLSLRFGKPSSPVTKRTCIVIIETHDEGERRHLGVAVDAVNAVIDIGARDIEPPPAFGARIDADFIHGLGKVSGKFVILLDVRQVVKIGGSPGEVTNDPAALALPALAGPTQHSTI